MCRCRRNGIRNQGASITYEPLQEISGPGQTHGCIVSRPTVSFRRRDEGERNGTDRFQLNVKLFLRRYNLDRRRCRTGGKSDSILRRCEYADHLWNEDWQNGALSDEDNNDDIHFPFITGLIGWKNWRIWRFGTYCKDILWQ